MKAYLILEDGHVFQGKSIGSEKEVISELVCNTSMTGYVEALTDPSYSGQAIVMTYPLIGNYGVCYEDVESDKVWANGFIVRELARRPSNFRSEVTLEQFLIDNQITGISGIDTRALTKLLRSNGTMNGMITTDENYVLEDVIKQLKEYKVENKVAETSCKEPIHYEGAGYKVALLDVGTRRNIVRLLQKRGCDITVYPYNTTAEELIEANPDGILVSSGSGNPKDCIKLIEELQKIYHSDIPVFAIGLGHQLMALATGGDVEKMSYGHHGSNYPVRNLQNKKVYISAQNHGYVVKENSLDRDVCEPSFINVNDGSVEGLHYLGRHIFTVQFQPEGCVEFLYDEFMNMMEVRANA